MNKKAQQLGIRLQPDTKAAWENLASSHFHQEPSALARSVIEEFMACFLPERELQRLGLAQLSVHRPGALIAHAVKYADSRREADLADKLKEAESSGKISEETATHVITAVRAIMERAPSAVIEDLTHKLTELAVRYGGEPPLEHDRPKNTKPRR